MVEFKVVIFGQARTELELRRVQSLSAPSPLPGLYTLSMIFLLFILVSKGHKLIFAIQILKDLLLRRYNTAK